MWISSIAVEGGILDGYRQTFSEGLNVIIGARGTGKSSVIELIRFCLDARPYSETAAQAAREHALGILGDGKITLELRDDSGIVTVSRTANDDRPQQDGDYLSPFIFSQAEIETVGLRAQSRLRLIDGFLPADIEQRRRLNHLRSQIMSITSEIRDLHEEIGSLEERTESLPEYEMRLEKLNQEAEEHSQLYAELVSEREELAALTPELTSTRVKIDGYERYISEVTGWSESFNKLVQEIPSVETFPSEAKEEEFKARTKPDLVAAANQMSSALRKVEQTRAFALEKLSLARERRTLLENHARGIRQRIEAKQQGASKIDRLKSDLAQQVSVLRSVIELIEDRSNRVVELTQVRDNLLMELEASVSTRSEDRKQVADFLSASLGPSIRIQIRPFAQTDEYESALLNVLRGSGIRYNELIPRIIATLSPRELATASEANDTEFIANQLSITEDRAWRLCEALAVQEGAELFIVDVDDDVEIELLDNTDYKGIDFLSMGQKCTAILPIILQHSERTIVLDQPEDHLDNAFVVNTLVRSIKHRSSSAQTIVATHNPNIPVLAEAPSVKVMESDGRRCFVESSGDVFSPSIVAAITSIMEGGKDAFEMRARFYTEHRSNE
ncbi:chromosome segregation protein [Phaeobacter piscinae]|uniref:Chromosome segregation protein n=1 Tax=Phaeobacter piscinae TaxID=1580596 RepID=A0ABM7D8F2_9RHOB|nr:AAA family ATPase [Phaeobacter piscinae]ATG35469.1 chromosome segregation protein [Phaeobacter piscinae]AUQ85989.1 chromosome segregation protein [Phaeobacter piscinae]AUR23873.1 chromosome segregation protein [Phaeobacter piscinae]